MKVFGIGLVEYLVLEKPSDFITIQIFRISKNVDSVKSFFIKDNDQAMLKLVGVLAFQNLWKADSTVFIKHDLEIRKGWTFEEELAVAGGEYNGKLAILLNCLWFIKDNSVFCRSIYLRNDGTPYCVINTSHTTPSNSLGEHAPVTFSQVELNHLVNIFNAVIKYFSYDTTNNYLGVPELKKPDTLRISFPAKINYIPYDKRLQRMRKALLYLHHARDSALLPQKISYYVIILETLFTTNLAGENVKQNLSYRTAFYTEQNEDSIYLVYKRVLESYGIRSQYLHGKSLDSSKAEIQNLRIISTNMDNIVRKALKKALILDENKFEMTTQERFNWLNALVIFNFKTGSEQVKIEPQSFFINGKL